LQHLLSEILTSIIFEIEKYTIHRNNKSNIVTHKNSGINKLFQHWIKSLSESGVVRMYTLNYDRLFKVLAERIGIPVFEGFE
jgi:hypothetical protein